MQRKKRAGISPMLDLALNVQKTGTYDIHNGVDDDTPRHACRTCPFVGYGL